jgi:glucose/arabinose dehydrogenase
MKKIFQLALLAGLMLGVNVLVSAQVNMVLTPILEASAVVDIKHAGDGSNRLFVVQQTGAVLVYKNGQLLDTPFIDVRRLITIGQEQGLLSIAFSPDYASNGEFYLFYTDQAGSSAIARYRVGSDPDLADETSAEVLLAVAQPQANHNGGRLEFGPDNMLYVGIGDGGGGGDPGLHGQNRATRLGTILRMDVESVDQGYQVPPDNPFFGQIGAVPELWAYGLRNPWRMSFDRLSGDLYIADVGQSATEEINFQTAAEGGGQNYGWNIFEGDGCFQSNPACATTQATPPVFAYGHDQGRCSITGGQVYRGPDYASLEGRYLYGDFCSGEIWALQQVNGQWSNELLGVTDISILTFGEDERGNVYVSGITGDGNGVVQLISDGPPVAQSGIPIDGSMSGTYVVMGMQDQGFFVTISNDAEGRPLVFIAWFTFDQNGKPLWLVGVDFLDPGDTTTQMTMEQIEGPIFLDFSNEQAVRTEFGEMTFTAVDCNTFSADYDFGTFGAGSFDLLRLTSIEGRECGSTSDD